MHGQLICDLPREGFSQDLRAMKSYGTHIMFVQNHYRLYFFLDIRHT